MLRHLSLCSMLLGAGLLVSYGQKAETKKVADEIVVKAKNGNVLFNHKSHVAAAKNDCKVCHDKLWPQDVAAPVNFKAPHKAVETKHTSCGFCHHQGGQAFQASAPANCKKCHGTAAAKKS